MNQEARDKLVEAELSGVKQIRGALVTKDGKCALGVLGVNEDASNIQQIRDLYGLNGLAKRCPFYGTENERPACFYYSPASRFEVLVESSLVIHLNDVHHLSFLDIARKFPESSSD